MALEKVYKVDTQARVDLKPMRTYLELWRLLMVSFDKKIHIIF